MLNIENQKKLEYYCKYYDSIAQNNKKLLFSKPDVTTKYITNTRKLFKRALIFYLQSGEKYDSTKFSLKSPNGTEYPKMGTSKFYHFKEIINNYVKNLNKVKEEGKEEMSYQKKIEQLERQSR